jgi:peroxiredoxin Q/BCP
VSPDKKSKYRIKAGDKAPNFVLPSHSGDVVSLRDFLGSKHVVLFFYPRDNSPGCTAEACGFRDNYDEFDRKGTEVLDISSDQTESHERFSSGNRLPFKLLSDEGGIVRKLYHVPKTLGLISGRVTYVIDKNGIIRHIFSSQFGPRKHVEEALQALKSISDKEG